MSNPKSRENENENDLYNACAYASKMVGKTQQAAQEEAFEKWQVARMEAEEAEKVYKASAFAPHPLRHHLCHHYAPEDWAAWKKWGDARWLARVVAPAKAKVTAAKNAAKMAYEEYLAVRVEFSKETLRIGNEHNTKYEAVQEEDLVKTQK